MESLPFHGTIAQCSFIVRVNARNYHLFDFTDNATHSDSTWVPPLQAKTPNQIPNTNAKPWMFHKWIKINQFELLFFHVILFHAFEWRKHCDKGWQQRLGDILRLKINKCFSNVETLLSSRFVIVAFIRLLSEIKINSKVGAFPCGCGCFPLI